MKVGRVVVVVVLGLAAMSVTAKDVEYLQNGKDRITVTDEPCTNPKVVEWTTRLRGAAYLSRMNRAKILWQGTHYEACVFKAGDMYAIVDEEGDSGYLAKRDFKPMSARYI